MLETGYSVAIRRSILDPPKSEEEESENDESEKEKGRDDEDGNGEESKKDEDDKDNEGEDGSVLDINYPSEDVEEPRGSEW